METAFCKKVHEERIDQEVITSEREKRIWRKCLPHFELRQDGGYCGTVLWSQPCNRRKTYCKLHFAGETAPQTTSELKICL